MDLAPQCLVRAGSGRAQEPVISESYTQNRGLICHVL